MQGLETTLLAHNYALPSEDNDRYISVNQTQSVDASLCPSNFSNACFNFFNDSDGVPDGWIDGWTCDPVNHPSQPLGKYNVPDYEFSFGEGEDRNLNGAADAGETCPALIDSDGDHLLDGWDILSTSTCSTLVCVSETRHYRSWGELNSTTHKLGTLNNVDIYQSAPTDPTNIDSDGDGLVDGNIAINGLPFELTTSHNGLSQTMFTDPSLQDTDADGLSDGLEIAGWEVHIIKESTKQEQKNWTVYSNPTIIDTEGDGVNDYFEFENQSDPQCLDTDGDYILDGDELQGALTQIEATPPEILIVGGTQIRVEVISTYENYICVKKEIKLTVRVRDSAGIQKVFFKLEGQRDQTKYLLDAPKEADVCATFAYDEWRGFWDGSDINVTAFDRNGNGNCTKTHIDGFCEGVAKYLIKAFWAFVEAVGKFLSELWNWIINAFKKLFEPIIEKISKAIEDVGRKLVNHIAQVFLKGFKITQTSGRSFSMDCDMNDWIKCGISIGQDLISCICLAPSGK